MISLMENNMVYVLDINDLVAVHSEGDTTVEIIYRYKRSLVIDLAKYNKTFTQFLLGIVQWRCRLLLQNALPYLSDGEREFLMTGILPDEWDEVMGEER